MKKFFFLTATVAAMLAAASCNNEENQPVDVKVQLTLDGENYAAADVTVSLAETSGVASFDAKTDASGVAAFTVPAGAYTASTVFKSAEAGVVSTFTGSAEVLVVAAKPETFAVRLTKVEASQVIIKELYCAACPKNDGTTTYANDAYVTLYNNSEVEADASELVIGVLQPANAHATNKWIADGKLAYEDAGYVPAYSAIWRFTSKTTIAPYSSLTIAIFGAIDHTATVTASVDLSKPEYYVMSKEGCAQITNAKYQVSENIPKNHYLAAEMFNLGNAWVLSSTSPALFIGKMSESELKALVANTEAFDLTGGATNVGWAPKFPVKNIMDAVDCWNAANIEKSNHRFPASVNTGHIALTEKLGHSFYRNVDKDATEALAENAGKLVYDYAGGTEADNGSTDPSKIDAEASIKAGAHIIYSDTNNSGKDFHERKVAAIK